MTAERPLVLVFAETSAAAAAWAAEHGVPAEGYLHATTAADVEGRRSVQYVDVGTRNGPWRPWHPDAWRALAVLVAMDVAEEWERGPE